MSPKSVRSPTEHQTQMVGEKPENSLVGFAVHMHLQATRVDPGLRDVANRVYLKHVLPELNRHGLRLPSDTQAFYDSFQQYDHRDPLSAARAKLVQGMAAGFAELGLALRKDVGDTLLNDEAMDYVLRAAQAVLAKHGLAAPLELQEMYKGDPPATTMDSACDDFQEPVVPETPDDRAMQVWWVLRRVEANESQYDPLSPEDLLKFAAGVLEPFEKACPCPKAYARRTERGGKRQRVA